MSPVQERFGIAVKLAHAFRDKFDYSEESHYDRLADLAFKAADALIRKRATLDAEAKLLAEKLLAETKAKEAAK